MTEDKLLSLVELLLERVEANQAATMTELRVTTTRLDGTEKRLDDQARILAALIPQRLAAVPAPAA